MGSCACNCASYKCIQEPKSLELATHCLSFAELQKSFPAIHLQMKLTSLMSESSRLSSFSFSSASPPPLALAESRPSGFRLRSIRRLSSNLNGNDHQKKPAGQGHWCRVTRIGSDNHVGYKNPLSNSILAAHSARAVRFGTRDLPSI